MRRCQKQRLGNVANAIGVAVEQRTGAGLISGIIVREITVQSLVKCSGTTGWMLSTSCARLNGPALKLVLLSNGSSS